MRGSLRKRSVKAGDSGPARTGPGPGDHAVVDGSEQGAAPVQGTRDQKQALNTRHAPRTAGSAFSRQGVGISEALFFTKIWRVPASSR